jgi:hypothetical protein
VSTFAAAEAFAQQAASESCSATGTTSLKSEKQLPPQPSPFGGVINRNALDARPCWEPQVVPPEGAPNVSLIITDNVGFGKSGTGVITVDGVEVARQKITRTIPFALGQARHLMSNRTQELKSRRQTFRLHLRTQENSTSSSSNWVRQGFLRLISRPLRRRLSNNAIEDDLFVNCWARYGEVLTASMKRHWWSPQAMAGPAPCHALDPHDLALVQIPQSPPRCLRLPHHLTFDVRQRELCLVLGYQAREKDWEFDSVRHSVRPNRFRFSGSNRESHEASSRESKAAVSGQES